MHHPLQTPALNCKAGNRQESTNSDFFYICESTYMQRSLPPVIVYHPWENIWLDPTFTKVKQSFVIGPKCLLPHSEQRVESTESALGRWHCMPCYHPVTTSLWLTLPPLFAYGDFMGVYELTEPTYFCRTDHLSMMGNWTFQWCQWPPHFHDLIRDTCHKYLILPYYMAGTVGIY